MLWLSVEDDHAVICDFELLIVDLQNSEHALSLWSLHTNSWVVNDHLLFLGLGLLSENKVTGRLALISLILACLSLFFSRGFFHKSMRALYFLLRTFLSL